jgi:hypothetical protein
MCPRPPPLRISPASLASPPTSLPILNAPRCRLSLAGQLPPPPFASGRLRPQQAHALKPFKHPDFQLRAWARRPSQHAKNLNVGDAWRAPRDPSGRVVPSPSKPASAARAFAVCGAAARCVSAALRCAALRCAALRCAALRCAALRCAAAAGLSFLGLPLARRTRYPKPVPVSLFPPLHPSVAAPACRPPFMLALSSVLRQRLALLIGRPRAPNLDPEGRRHEKVRMVPPTAACTAGKPWPPVGSAAQPHGARPNPAPSLALPTDGSAWPELAQTPSQPPPAPPCRAEADRKRARLFNRALPPRHTASAGPPHPAPPCPAPPRPARAGAGRSAGRRRHRRRRQTRLSRHYWFQRCSGGHPTTNNNNTTTTAPPAWNFQSGARPRPARLHVCEEQPRSIPECSYADAI